jgi:hypothetical protein
LILMPSDSNLLFHTTLAPSKSYNESQNKRHKTKVDLILENPVLWTGSESFGYAWSYYLKEYWSAGVRLDSIVRSLFCTE